MITSHTLFAILVLITTMASFINVKFLKLPKTIGLTIISGILSLSILFLLKFSPIPIQSLHQQLTSVNFQSTFLDVMLGYLLFAGALHINAVNLKKEFFPVIYLASIGVILSTLLVGVMLYQFSIWFQFGIPISTCLIFGALISPTDPIAVLNVLKIVKTVPERLKLRISGEALFNDAAGILFFVILLNVFSPNTPNPTPFSVLISLLQEAGGGILVGWFMGLIAAFLLKKINDYETGILLTLSVASAGFIFAQSIHVSAPISMVIAGLVIGQKFLHNECSTRMIRSIDQFWQLMDEVLNSFLFVLIGLEILTIEFDPIIIPIGILTFFIIFFARFISVAIPTYLTGAKHSRRRRIVFLKENLLMTWGGLRGGISIALALSIPNHSSTIISITYVVVLASILIQGSSFRFAVRKIFPEKIKKTTQ